MPLYESVLIARQDISQPQVETLTDAMAAVIAEHGGNVTKKEYWGLRALAYRIKKNRKGHYMLLNIDAPSPAVHEMERQLRFNEDVLRFLTVRVEELEEGPSMMQRSGRDGREDRGGRRGESFGDGRRGRERGERGPRDGEGGTSEAPKRNQDAERGEES